MAQRRMFSKDITEHDAFLEMPLSTQALYFHLGMQADDDGFVSPNRIMRMIGSQADDLKILIGKKFVLAFDDGILVIKHWKMNNYLRPDRYKETNHVDKLALLSTKDNGSYSWSTTGIPDDIPTVAAGKVRIGKDRIVKNTEENKPSGSKVRCGEFQNVFLTLEEKKKLVDRYGRSATVQIVEELSTYMKSRGKAYRDHYATLLNWAKRKGTAEIVKTAPPPDLTISEEQAAENARRIQAITNKLAEDKSFKP